MGSWDTTGQPGATYREVMCAQVTLTQQLGDAAAMDEISNKAEAKKMALFLFWHILPPGLHFNRCPPASYLSVAVVSPAHCNYAIGPHGMHIWG
jgi:hypothetical protein